MASALGVWVKECEMHPMHRAQAAKAQEAQAKAASAAQTSSLIDIAFDDGPAQAAPAQQVGGGWDAFGSVQPDQAAP